MGKEAGVETIKKIFFLPIHWTFLQNKTIPDTNYHSKQSVFVCLYILSWLSLLMGNHFWTFHKEKAVHKFCNCYIFKITQVKITLTIYDTVYYTINPSFCPVMGASQQKIKKNTLYSLYFCIGFFIYIVYIFACLFSVTRHGQGLGKHLLRKLWSNGSL